MATQGQLVREWAKQNGYQVGVRGRIAPAIWSAYAQSHEGFQREAPQEYTAICKPGCGRRWTGYAECHCPRCHRHFSCVDNFDAHIDAHGACLDPLTVTLKGNTFREKQTVWGATYVRDGERWTTQTDLFD